MSENPERQEMQADAHYVAPDDYDAQAERQINSNVQPNFVFDNLAAQLTSA